MSLVTVYSNNIKRKKEELNRLKKERVRYVDLVNSCSKKIINATNQAKNTKSSTTYKSKLNEIERENKRKFEAGKKVSYYDKKITMKENELQKEEQKLLKEQEKEAKELERKRQKVIEEINIDIGNQKIAYDELNSEVKKLKETKEKINILFIASNPDDTSKLKLDKEAREIHESIQKSLKRDSINFETRWATRVTDLLQFINEVNPTILHFSGHGTPDGKLVFQDNKEQAKMVNIDTLVEMINASSDDIRLVVLNNCFSSIVSEKVVDTVEASIGMNTSIGDEAAIVFASQLYSAIGFGHSLEKAFRQAIVALKLYEIPESGTPKLFVNNNFDAKNIYLVTKNEK